MDATSRALLLSNKRQKRQVIPVRRNGCVCFIPVAQTVQEPTPNDILADCMRNCFELSRELGFNPTPEQCRECCTTCIDQGEGENCREACVLGDPIERGQVAASLTQFLGLVHEYRIISTSGDLITYQVRTRMTTPYVIWKTVYPHIINQYYGNFLHEGFNIGFAVVHKTEPQDINSLVPDCTDMCTKSVTVGDRPVGRAQTVGGIRLIYNGGPATLQVYFPSPCHCNQLEIFTTLTMTGTPTAQFIIFINNRILEATVPVELSSNDSIPIDGRNGLYCNNTPVSSGSCVTNVP